MSLVRFQIIHSSLPISYRDSRFCLLAIPSSGVSVCNSDLITSSATKCDEYFAGYDDTLRRLLNVHAPLGSEVYRSRTSAASWLNSVYRQAKVKTRRLAKIYRATGLLDQGAVMSAARRSPFVQRPMSRVPDGILQLLVKFNKQLF